MRYAETCRTKSYTYHTSPYLFSAIVLHGGNCKNTCADTHFLTIMLIGKHPNMAYMTYSMSHVYIPYAGSDRKYFHDFGAVSNLFNLFWDSWRKQCTPPFTPLAPLSSKASTINSCTRLALLPPYC